MAESSLPTEQEAIRLGLAVVNDPGVGLILERHAPNLTVCPACSVDDFTHQEGCALAARVEAVWEYLDNPEDSPVPHELGPLVYVSTGDKFNPEATEQGQARAEQRSLIFRRQAWIEAHRGTLADQIVGLLEKAYEAGWERS